MDDSKLVVIRSFSSVGPIRNEMMPVRLVVNEADARRAEEILGAKFDQEEFDKESAKRRKKP